MSKYSRSEVQFCHTLFEKIVAVITILSHDVNIFVSCIEVIFQNTKISERESKTLFNIAELFVSALKTLSHSAENFVTTITNLSSLVETFASWIKVLNRSAKNSATSITIFSYCVKVIEMNYNFLPVI